MTVIIVARVAVSRLTIIRKDGATSRRNELRLMKTPVFPHLPLWCWNVENQSGRQKKNWYTRDAGIRGMLRIPWNKKRTNNSILQELDVQKRLFSICYRRILQFFEHIVLRQEDNLKKVVDQGNVAGQISRDGWLMPWLHQVKEKMNRALSQLLPKAEDRVR